MDKEELLYFVKFVFKQIINEFLQIFNGLKKIARPRFWIYVFCIVLLYQLAIDGRWKVSFTLLIIFVLWMLDIYYVGHWKGEYRKKKYDNYRKKAKKD